MAMTLTDVLKNEFRDFRALFTSKLISSVAVRYLELDSCREGSNRLFPFTPVNVACSHEELMLNTREGAEFWFRLYIGRSYEDEQTLNRLTGSTLADFDRYFLDDNSDFIMFVNSIFDAIGMGRIGSI
jgi:hypothetical protein